MGTKMLATKQLNNRQDFQTGVVEIAILLLIGNSVNSTNSER